MRLAALVAMIGLAVAGCVLSSMGSLLGAVCCGAMFVPAAVLIGGAK